jgi:hypothetical protein
MCKTLLWNNKTLIAGRNNRDISIKQYNLKGADSQCCWKKYSDFGGGKK